jgi:ADP-heptose:LPS heptosyltransferase
MIVDVDPTNAWNGKDGQGIGDAVSFVAIAAGLAQARPADRVRLMLGPGRADWARLWWPDSHERGTCPDKADEVLYPYCQGNRSISAYQGALHDQGVTEHEQWARNAGFERPVRPPVTLTDADRQWAADTLEMPRVLERKVVLLAPFANSMQRMWPPTYWMRVVEALKNAHLHPVVVDGHQDARLKLFWCQQVKAPTPGQLCALVQAADLTIGNDSAVCHVAGMLNAPALALCGPSPGRVVFGWYGCVDVLQGTGPCTCCAWRPERGWRLACRMGCEVMMNLRPARVLEAITRKLSGLPAEETAGVDNEARPVSRGLRPRLA